MLFRSAQPTCEAARGSLRCPRALPALAAAAPGASYLPAAARTHVRPLLTRCPRPDGEAGRLGGMWGVGRAPRLPSPLSRFSPAGSLPRPSSCGLHPAQALWSPPKPWLLPEPSPLLFFSCPSTLNTTVRPSLPRPLLLNSVPRLLSTYFHLVLFLSLVSNIRSRISIPRPPPHPPAPTHKFLRSCL